MTEKQKEIIIKSLSWFIALFILIFIGVNNIFADTISDYSTKYYYYNSNDNSSTNSTVYRSGDNNFVTLYGAGPPAYNNGEGFNGFYNQINYKIVKGSIYTLTLNVQYTNLLDSEFSRNDINNRLLTTNFAHCDGCNVTAVSGSIRRYNNINGAVSNLYDFVVHMSYTFIATYTTNTFNIGSYTGDDRVLGVDNHLYNSIVSVYSLEINENNSSTIINQNETIINQNQQIIDQNNSNTQDIINNNNTNTENILNNQNQNTQEQIESQKVCTNKTIKGSNVIIKNHYLRNDATLSTTDGTFGVTDYIQLDSNSLLTASTKPASGSASSCFYDSSKTLISCFYNRDIVVNTQITIPNNTKYVRFTINYDIDIPSFNLTTCINGNQALNDSIEEQNKTSKGILGKIGDLFDNLFSNDDADISGLDNMVGWLPPGPVDSIINLPLSLFNSLTNTLSGTCTPVTLTLPFVNQDLTLPCFDAYMSQYVTGFNTLWTWVGVTVSVFILYRYLLNLYKWIDDTLTMRENNLPGYYDDNMWGGA